MQKTKTFFWSWCKFAFRMIVFVLLVIISYRIPLFLTVPCYMYLLNIYPQFIGNFVYSKIGVYIYNLLNGLYKNLTCRNICLCLCISNILWILFVIMLLLIYKMYESMKIKYPELV
jgi:hypothetical protein